MSRAPMVFTTPDKHGYSPNLDMLSTTHRHVKSGGIYRIVGYCYDAGHKEWQYRYMGIGGGAVEFTRSVQHWHEITENGTERFVAHI